MMSERLPPMRTDLEFLPYRHEDRQLVVIRDHLGLVQEGKALPLGLFRLLSLLDGQRSMVDLQTLLMRERGGLLVGSDEVESLIAHLDESYLLNSERFRKRRDEIVEGFTSMSVRPCSHCGRAYPGEAEGLRSRLGEILSSQDQAGRRFRGDLKALVAPHIDLSVGQRTYASAYRELRGASPTRVVLLGVGHQLTGHLFCITEKDFETPLGLVHCDRSSIRKLWDSSGVAIAPDDFLHRSEHSIEFQVIFLQHLLLEDSFEIVPILCGSIQSAVPEYGREAYLQKAGAFLGTLRGLLEGGAGETLLVAGVDLSHVGPKFGHEMPAAHLEARTKAHDQTLLEALCRLDADAFWGESGRVRDRYNVCGFSALASLLEVLPPSRGEVLGYEIWHEEPTQSAVSFAAMAFREE
ncbi:MAG: AmmeMemoRadiSam system protein B [Deltaproteobacteria bacterium]|nr:AmmeMemoRadiSam system protein B [Deltaproteobacteria bacterium]